jgi:hypothetical protein
MDPSSAGFWMLLTTIGLPAAFGIIDAWRNGRGVFGWIVSVVAATAGGIALMLAAVNFARPASGPPPSEAIAAVQIFGGLIAGSLLTLWIVNRFRG